MASLSLIRRRELALLAAVAVAWAAPAGAQEPDDVGRGREVFQYWCAPCHAPGPRHPGTQALEGLYKGAKPAALEEPDLSSPSSRGNVRSGVSIMPFRKTEISNADLAALAAYLAGFVESTAGRSSRPVRG
jgi:mono/diheme cytochrome c family protein